MFKIKSQIVTKWRPYLSILLLFALVIGILTFRLATITDGPSVAEAEYLSQLQSQTLTFKDTLTSAANLPFTAGLYALQKADFDSLFALRSLVAFFGLTSTVLMYVVLRKWHTARIALLGTILYATSAWFLHVSRSGSPIVLQFGTITLIACGIWLNNKKASPSLMFTSIVMGVSLLYIPGLFWLILTGLIWQRRRIKKQASQLGVKWLLAGGGTILLLLTPLIASTVKDINTLRTLAAIPAELPTAMQFIKNLINVPGQLFVYGPDTPTLWLGRLPLLDFFTSAMILVGLYAVFKSKLDRGAVFAIGLIISSLFIALGGVNIAILLPVSYLMITAGVNLMIQQWQTVFPRNPIARALGFGIISLALSMSVLYNLRHYFVAWPNAPETKTLFVEKV